MFYVFLKKLKNTFSLKKINIVFTDIEEQYIGKKGTMIVTNRIKRRYLCKPSFQKTTILIKILIN